MRLHGKKLQNATNKGLKRSQRQIEPEIAKKVPYLFAIALTFESKDKTKKAKAYYSSIENEVRNSDGFSI